jgi:hypothetical protein
MRIPTVIRCVDCPFVAKHGATSVNTEWGPMLLGPIKLSCIRFALDVTDYYSSIHPECKLPKIDEDGRVTVFL